MSGSSETRTNREGPDAGRPNALDPRHVGIVRSRAPVSERLSGARADQLLQITAAIADAVTEQELYTALVDEVAAAIGAASAGLWIADPGDGELKLVRSLGYSAEVMRRLASLAPNLRPSLPIVDAHRQGVPIWIGSPQELLLRYPHAHAFAGEGGFYRLASLPLMLQHDSIGVLAITCEESGETCEEREMLLLVARYASQGLQRLQLLSAERQSRSRADALAQHWALLGQFSHTMAAAHLDLDERVRVAAKVLASSFRASVNIGLLRDDGLLHLTGVHHPEPAAHDLLEQLRSQAVLRPGEGVAGTVLATRRSLLLPRIDAIELAEDPMPGLRDFLRQHPVHALMSACLRVGGRAIGTVTVTRTREGETFTQDDLRLLEELASRAALAIHNGQLFNETQDAQRRAEQLYLFADALMAAACVEEVVEAALSAIEGALRADRSAVLLFDDQGVMRFRGWRGLSDDYRARVEGHSPWDVTATEPRAIVVEDAHVEPSLAAFRPLFRQEGIGALAFVPLVSDGRLLGKFMVYYNRAHHFSEHDLTTAHAVAAHLAAAISRYEALDHLKAQLLNNERLAAVLAHDLRNPLAAIMTAANMMMERSDVQQAGKASGEPGVPSQNMGALARIMRSSGQRMRAMIEQLLDFARARAGGGLGVLPKQCNMSELCSQALEEIQLANTDRQLVRSFQGDLEGTWDPDRMLQLTSNLLANAVQHGQPDKPVTLRADGTSSLQIVLEVHNEGAIPPETMEQLFEPFHRGSAAGRKAEGLGLGLFIVREIVRAHGGMLRVTSSEAAGTAFRVELNRHCRVADLT